MVQSQGSFFWCCRQCAFSVSLLEMYRWKASNPQEAANFKAQDLLRQLHEENDHD